VDLLPRSVASGRGWYTGTIHSRDGLHGASIAQESLFGRAPGGRA
jgi:acyl-CoA thioesterase-2